jgi:hypothetical protein
LSPHTRSAAQDAQKARSADQSVFGYQPETANGAQKRGEPCDEQPQVVAGSHEDGVDRIAGGALEVISLE